MGRSWMSKRVRLSSERGRLVEEGLDGGYGVGEWDPCK